MPLAKSAEQVSEQQPVIEHPQADIPLTTETIPIDVFYFFDATPLMSPLEKERLADIYEFAKSRCEDPTTGNVMHALSVIDQKLGLAGNEKRIDRIWNYIRLKKKADEVTKRYEALERPKW